MKGAVATSVGSGSWFQGTIAAISVIEPMKNSRMRQMTVLVARRTLGPGSSDSAAAITAISVPK